MSNENIEYIVFVKNENTFYEFKTHEEVVDIFGSNFTAIWNSDENVFNVEITRPETLNEKIIESYINKNIMNRKKLTQNFQDLIIQKKMPAFRNFKNKIQQDFVIFQPGDIKKIYTFISVMQKHPMRCALSYALKTMFEMLLKGMIDEKNVVSVFEMKTQKRYNIEIHNIQKHFKKKKIIKLSEKDFIIPYIQNVNILQRKEDLWLNSLFNDSLASFNLYEHEQDQNRDE